MSAARTRSSVPAANQRFSAVAAGPGFAPAPARPAVDQLVERSAAGRLVQRTLGGGRLDRRPREVLRAQAGFAAGVGELSDGRRRVAGVQRVQEGGVGVAVVPVRRRDVERHAAAHRRDRRERAQDEPVARLDVDLVFEPQRDRPPPGRPASSLRSSSTTRARCWAVPWCSAQPLAVAQRPRAGQQLSQASKCAVTAPPAASAATSQRPRSSDSLPTPRRLTPTRWPASAGLGGVVVHLHAARRHAPRRPARCAARRRPRCAPRHSVPVATVPMPLSGEDAIDGQARGALAPCAAPRRPRPPPARRAARGCRARRASSRVTTGAPAYGGAGEEARARRLAPAPAARRRPGRPWSGRPPRAGTPSSSRIARCSTVCGITPSSAATTSRKRSTPVAPATMVRTKRS